MSCLSADSLVRCASIDELTTSVPHAGTADTLRNVTVWYGIRKSIDVSRIWRSARVWARQYVFNNCRRDVAEGRIEKQTYSMLTSKRASALPSVFKQHP